MDDALIHALTNLGGTAAVVVGVVYIAWKVIARIMERMIAAIDAAAQRIAEHTTKDLEHHAEVKEAVIRLEGKMDGILDWNERTPVEGPSKPGKRQRTNPGEYYRVRRKDEE